MFVWSHNRRDYVIFKYILKEIYRDIGPTLDITRTVTLLQDIHTSRQEIFYER